MPGSPFPAGGAGTGSIVGSQGALQITRDGRFLLAVDAGSNQISVLRIGADGSLQAVSGGPVASGGIQPISITVHDNLVYVANEGNGTVGSNYTGCFEKLWSFNTVANSFKRAVSGLMNTIN